MFVLVYFTLAKCYFRVTVTSNFDVGNPSNIENLMTIGYDNTTISSYP